MRNGSNLRGPELAGFRPSFVNQLDCAPIAEQGGVGPPRRLPALACFRGRCRHLSASRSTAESERFELPERSSVTPYTASSGAPRAIRTLSVRGRRADRTPAGLSSRPPVSNRVPCQLGQPSVAPPGLEPGHPAV